MIIAKFGGKSVATAKNIETICRIVKSEIKNKPVIVVSAVSQVTNMLLDLSEADSIGFEPIFNRIKDTNFGLATQLWAENIPKDVTIYLESCLENVKKNAKKMDKTKADMDSLLMNGELMSSYIVACALSHYGIKSQQVVATDLIVTNSEFGSAEFIPGLTVKKTKQIIDPLIKAGIVPVITGFLGATEKGEPTTLGRGGSDYSASIIGFALDATEVQIWSDVDGVFTADPRAVKAAKMIKNISFKEASELAYFGAKILHPSTLRPAMKAGIPVRVMNTMNPKSPGTIIQKESEKNGEIKAITSKKSIKLINLYSEDMLFGKGFLASIFAIFAKHSISVDLVSVSEVSVSVTLDNQDNLQMALKELSEFTAVANIPDFGIVSLVGDEIVKIPHIMKRIFAILDEQKIGVKMISLGATDVNISLVIESSKIDEAVEILHEGLIN
ncbi:MAG TPA: aspartate kinase [Candidatus Saccharimonadales bacterium]|nr:aspartate kinase [Candidatus Saccharimonadales bacterium]